MKNLLKYLINYDYWVIFFIQRKLHKALLIFFEEEDSILQTLFLKNFIYPEDMTDKPVRMNTGTGEIYYVINFNSKELFFNEATLQTAFGQSLSILQENLPIGVTEHLIPEITGRIEDSFSILVTLNPNYDNIKTINIIKAFIKPSISLVTLISIILLLLKYV